MPLELVLLFLFIITRGNDILLRLIISRQRFLLILLLLCGIDDLCVDLARNVALETEELLILRVVDDRRATDRTVGVCQLPSLVKFLVQLAEKVHLYLYLSLLLSFNLSINQLFPISPTNPYNQRHNSFLSLASL